MRDGLIRVAAASPALQVANCRYNTEQIIQTIERAHSEGVSVLTLPELCVTGYTCGDLLRQSTLLNGAADALKTIAAATAGKELLVFVGAPIVCAQKLYDCAVALCDGEILGVVPKTHLLDHAEFCESRLFVQAPVENTTVTIDGRAVPFGAKL